MVTKKSFLLITVLFFLSVSSLLWIVFNQSLSFSKISFPFVEKDYKLEPDNTFFSSPAKYELVKITNNPTSLTNFRQYHRELDSIVNHPESISVYLNDRISQTIQWGSELKINGDIDNINQLNNWWKKNKPRFWEFYASWKLNSWEAILAQYYYLADYQINNLLGKKVIDKGYLSSLKSFFYANQRDLILSIYQVKKNDEEKKYLNALINILFNSLHRKIDHYLPYPDVSTIQYSLLPLINDNHYGTYEILVDAENIPSSYLNKTYLQINEQKFSLHTVNDKNKKNYFYAKSKLGPKTNKILLKIPEASILSATGWYQRPQSEPGVFRYYYDISHYQLKQAYLISINSAITKPAMLQLESIVDNNKSQNKNLIISEVLLPQITNQQFTYPIQFSTETNLKYLYFIVSASIPLSLQDLSKISIKFQPLWTPSILLNKTENFSLPPLIKTKRLDLFNYEVAVDNTTQDQNAEINRLFSKEWLTLEKKPLSRTGYLLKIQSLFLNLLKKTVIAYVLYCLIFLIYLKKDLLLKLSCEYKTKIDKLINSNPLKRFLNSLPNSVILSIKVILYLFIFYDIFILSTSYLTVNIILCLMYLAINSQEKSKPHLTYTSALIFLASSAFLLMINKEILANGSAIWAFLFIIVGTIEQLLTNNKKVIIIQPNPHG